VSAANWPNNARDIRVTFEAGIPTQIDGEAMEPVRLIEMLNELGAAHGVGRGIHVGDTILGIKGRVAFEAPAAAILLPAHRELEKLVLTSSQMIWKGTLGEVYGSFLHEARFFDPLTRDIEAFLTSSQRRVRGDVNVRLFAGQASVLGVTSPHSLMGVQGARYGEESSLWTGPEAAGFGKLYGLQQVLHVRAGKQEG
jgi:argininosuccinate synthase